MMAQPYVESRDSQAAPQELVIRIEPCTGPYYYAVESPGATDNATAEAIMKDIVRRYRDAWEKLAEM
jgi:hypothetical protein